MACQRQQLRHHEFALRLLNEKERKKISKIRPKRKRNRVPHSVQPRARATQYTITHGERSQQTIAHENNDNEKKLNQINLL